MEKGKVPVAGDSRVGDGRRVYTVSLMFPVQVGQGNPSRDPGVCSAGGSDAEPAVFRGQRQRLVEEVNAIMQHN